MSIELSEKAIKVRIEYMRKWRSDNKDKVKKHQVTYWENKAKES